MKAIVRVIGSLSDKFWGFANNVSHVGVIMIEQVLFVEILERKILMFKIVEEKWAESPGFVYARVCDCDEIAEG